MLLIQSSIHISRQPGYQSTCLLAHHIMSPFNYLEKHVSCWRSLLMGDERREDRKNVMWCKEKGDSQSVIITEREVIHKSRRIPVLKNQMRDGGADDLMWILFLEFWSKVKSFLQHLHICSVCFREKEGWGGGWSSWEEMMRRRGAMADAVRIRDVRDLKNAGNERGGWELMSHLSTCCTLWRLIVHEFFGQWLRKRERRQKRGDLERPAADDKKDGRLRE